MRTHKRYYITLSAEWCHRSSRPKVAGIGRKYAGTWPQNSFSKPNEPGDEWMMVDVDNSSLQADSQPKSVGLVGW